MDMASINCSVVKKNIVEIYILIDHITTTLNRSLPKVEGLKNSDPRSDTYPSEWLTHFCAIDLPAGNVKMDAEDAGFVLQLRDALNQHAAPACGNSIAFTLLVAGGWRRAGRWKCFRNNCSAEKVEGQGGGAIEDVGGDGENAAGASPSGENLTSKGWGARVYRQNLAEIAFPDLIVKARAARRLLRYWIPAIMVILLIGTTLLSFQAARGAGIVAQFTRALETRQELREKAVDSMKGCPLKLSSGVGKESTRRSAYKLEGNVTVFIDEIDLSDYNLHSRCDLDEEILDEAEGALLFARDNVKNWEVENWFLAVPIWNWRLVDRALCFVGLPGNLVDDCKKVSVYPHLNQQTAIVTLSGLVGIVLPVLYGVLGAMAGQVRETYLRIKNNTLMPRHVMLFYAPWLLGSIAGATISLFFGSDEKAGSVSSSGVITEIGDNIQLTASALSFLAGLGSEAMFDLLESLIRRVLVFDSSRPAVR